MDEQSNEKTTERKKSLNNFPVDHKMDLVNIALECYCWACGSLCGSERIESFKVRWLRMRHHFSKQMENTAMNFARKSGRIGIYF